MKFAPFAPLSVLLLLFVMPLNAQHQLSEKKPVRLSAFFNPASNQHPRPVNLQEYLGLVESEMGNGTKIQPNSFILIRVKVSECGDYLAHEVGEFTHASLKNACEQYIRKLKWSPAFQNGTPVDTWVSLPVWTVNDREG